jgi:hypothetical protein
LLSLSKPSKKSDNQLLSLNQRLERASGLA